MSKGREEYARLLALHEGIAVERSLAGRPTIISANGETRGPEPTIVHLDELEDEWEIEWPTE